MPTQPSRLRPGKRALVTTGTLFFSTLCITGSLLTGCSGQSAAPQQSASEAQQASSQQSTPTLTDVAILRDEDFGGIYFDITIEDFNKLGFAFGDSLDVTFSNGYELKGIPYYNGYYTKLNEPLVVGYPGYPHVKVGINFGDPLWEVAGVTKKDTATITVAEPGKFLVNQQTFDMTYTNERSDYSSDEVFANFRASKGGKLKDNWIYRSASPIENDYNRASTVSALASKAKINFILDLADSEKDIDEVLEDDKQEGVDTSFFTSLRDKGDVAPADLGAAYPTEDYRTSLVTALNKMAEHDGPYLVHCTEGKDRTGFVCLLLESLSGASYDEMLEDYMLSYDNYFGINKEADPKGYEAIIDLRFNDMINCIAENASDNPNSADYVEGARTYLRSGGMTDEQIDALLAKISK